MKKKNNKRFLEILKNGGLFLFLMLLTFYMICKDNSPAELAAAMKAADIRFLFLGVCAMAVFLFCEGLNIARCLRLFGYPVRQTAGLKYALTGFFFSSVTPSASGGQPMQLYFMSRDGIQVSHGTLALLFELLSFQFITIALGILGFFYQHRLIAETMGNFRILLMLGLIANTAVMIILIFAVFSKKMIAKLAGLVVKLVRMFSKEKAELVREKLMNQLQEYRESAAFLKQNSNIFLKTVLTSLVQILAMYSVPFLIYRSFDLFSYGLPEVVALQAVLYVAVSALPLPGALGVSESGFLVLFKTLFPAALLPGAMILSRGISFYLFVLVSGLASSAFILKKKEVRHGLHNSYCRGRQGYCGAAEALSGKQRV